MSNLSDEVTYGIGSNSTKAKPPPLWVPACAGTTVVQGCRCGKGASPSPQSSPIKGEEECNPSARRLLGRATVVAVLEADYVVFAEVVAGLHLYDLDGGVSGVLQAVRDADGDVDRLGLTQQEPLVALDDAPPCRSQRPSARPSGYGTAAIAPRRGVNGEALHLESGPAVDGLVAPPWAVYPTVVLLLRPAFLSEGGYEILDVLYAVLAGHQYGGRVSRRL